MPELAVRLFGVFQVTYSGQPVTTLGAPRQQALLAWLLLHRGAPQPRRAAASALWPDSSEAQALTNLRRELHHLRRNLPALDGALDVTPQTLHWRQDAPRALDVADFERFSPGLPAAAVSVAELEQAAGLYTAALLPGLEGEWLEPHRQRLHERAVAVLEALLQTAEGPQAVRHAQRLVALEPYRDSAHARLMEGQLDAGDPGAARRSYHACVQLLASELDTSPGPLVQAAYRRLQEQAESPPPVTAGELPLIGRQIEWRRALEAWRAARSGASRALLISGEAGIGKTRLAEALLAWVAAEGGRTARTRSYAAEGRLAYAPAVEWLRSPALRGALTQVPPPWRMELARLLPELAPPRPAATAEPLSEGWQRPRLFEALARACLGAPTPTLLLLDDLQWCDRDTLEWLHFLLRFEARAPLLLVFTLRREEQDGNPAVRPFLQTLRQRGVLDETELAPLSPDETAALAHSLLPGTLSSGAQARLYRATEGHPLFIVEAIRAGIPLDGPEGASAFPPSPRVQAVISSRLEQLSPAARGVAHLAATVGRAFDTGILQAAGELDEGALAAALDELWRREIIREQPGSGAYDFTHDRLREGAAGEPSPARRRLLHRRVARVLAARHAADPGAVAAQLATHLEQAGDPEAAVTAYLRAAERANSMSASQEAVHQARQALRLTTALPPGVERQRTELAAHTATAAALTALRGFTPPELEHTLKSALELAETLGDNAAVIRSLWGLLALHMVRGNIRLARTLAEQAQGLAGEDSGLLTDTHQTLGGLDQVEGKLAAAAGHFAVANRLYRQHRHRLLPSGTDVGVFSLAWGAHGLWLQGRVLEARAYAAQAAAIAEEFGHPFTQVQAVAYRTVSYQLEGDLDAAWSAAEATIEGCERHNIAYYREWGVIVGGWVQARRGDPAAGLERIRRGLDALQRLDAALRRPYYLALLAEVQLQLGNAEAARAALDVAQSVAGQSGEVWYLPEVFRLRGLTEPARAEGVFRQALAVARSYGAASLELRAATSLAGDLRAAGRTAEAAVALEPVVATFSASLLTPDLTRARDLLATLT